MVLLDFWQGKQMGFYDEVSGEQKGYLVACLSLTLASFGFPVFWFIYYAFVLHFALRVDDCCSNRRFFYNENVSDVFGRTGYLLEYFQSIYAS